MSKDLSTPAGSDANAASSGQPRQIEFVNRNFSLPAGQLLGYAGVPSYLRRARDLEDPIARFWKGIEAQYTWLAGEVQNSVEFARRWYEAVDALDLHEIEGVVEDYNNYFPIEADLPMDPRVGDFTYRGKKFEPAVAPTRADVLARFPAERVS